MRATRDDIVECYRTILNREAESEVAINRHLSANYNTWDLIKSFLGSDERKEIEDEGGALSIMKCFKENYLAKSIQKGDRVGLFLENLNFIWLLLREEAFEDILKREVILFVHDKCSILVRFSRKIFVEGELSLVARYEQQEIYNFSFTFVRGRNVHVESEWVILLSRMQGSAGAREQSKAFTKTCGEITPQYLLFSALTGLADRSGIKVILAVSAANQVSFNEQYGSLMQRNYNAFYRSLGSVEAGETFFRMNLPLQQKDIGDIKETHRSRTREKRKRKAEIGATVGASWAALIRETDGTFATGTATDTQGEARKAGFAVVNADAEAGHQTTQGRRQADLAAVVGPSWATLARETDASPSEFPARESWRER